MVFSPDFPADQRMRDFLAKRKEDNSLRALRPENTLIDFSSNDYLGFARSSSFQQRVSAKVHQGFSTGSTGSRLLHGNSRYAEALEKRIASYHHAEAGLLFNSGYDANLGLLSALGSRGTTILYDEFVHASARDGIRLSHAQAYSFRHNDMKHLEQRLQLSSGPTFVVLESIYSMDGDEGPLKEAAALCQTFGANLIVDEAHATGVKGGGGEGLVVSLGLADAVFARVHTFGKAMGVHGAIVLGSNLLRDLLINFSRAFIYTTALPPASLAAIDTSYDQLQENKELIGKLETGIKLFQSEIRAVGGVNHLGGVSPIQCLHIPGNAEVKKVAALLEADGFDVRPILYPTVPRGKERLRICIHAFNTAENISQLAITITKNRFN